MSDSDRTPADEFRATEDGAGVELAYAGRNTFLKAEARDVSDLDDVDVGILGAPYDGALSNRPGARYGPEAIRRASGWWAYLANYKGGLTNVNTGKRVDFSGVEVADCGDVPVFPMDHERTADSIEAHVATVAERAFPLLLGGDHYCTYPAVRGFARGIDADSIGLVQIDAHSDTVAESDVFGAHYHGSSTRLVAESPFGDYERVSQVGVRGYEGPDFLEFVDETGLNLYPMREVHERGVADVVADAVDAAATDADAVYVTFDIDSVDPSVAPGTGTPEPDGLSPHQALRVMEVVGRHDAVGGADLMEVSPTYDPTASTQTLGAYLLVTLVERLFAE
ncbi:agmatinase family protein [Salinirarus marinus]|uniref:agmatinase family protein n=1 Tax=Salinirarus marinus TaxID=3068310 RepID=UPI003C6C8ACC